MLKKITIPFLATLLITMGVKADVRLPRIFGDSMVLQRNQPIPIWGWAKPNESVTVQFHRQTKKAKADSQGKWKVILDQENEPGPFQLVVSGKNKITLNGILVGEVWLCSGQSNMEWPLRTASNGQKEMAEANYPQIRHIYIPKAVASNPAEDLKEASAWKAATSKNVGDFTAVGYFFAKKLYEELHVPIGLVHSSWGGTDVETWTSRKAFEGSDEFKSMIQSMPVVDLDAIAKRNKEAIQKLIQDTQGQLPTSEVAQSWKEASLDDSKWRSIQVPGLWETQGIADFDGIVWYRKKFTLVAGDIGKDAMLELAMIDDQDETYVNGTLVGSTGVYNAKRVYRISAGLLKAGENVVAVRITDTGGGGGIYGDAADVKLTTQGNSIPLSGDWRIRFESYYTNAPSVDPNAYPSLLYNGMINPLVPFAIKGVIWYQGENNSGRAYQYRKAFPLMINDWRQRWGQGNFPFYFVQLSSFSANNGDSKKGSTWAELREAQTMTLTLPNTGMATTVDIGDSKDIHPRNKQDVGVRLAAIALNKNYGKNNTAFSGPIYKRMSVEGNKVLVYFDEIGSGLVSHDRYGYLKGFEVAGADQKFYYAKASIENDHVVVWSDGVSSPVAVRYAWADDASEANLFNQVGLPAVPFRTDQWKGVTAEAKYWK
jgi:sialate O-acetylesterase